MLAYLMKWWQLADDEIEWHPDFIVPFGYGLLRPDALPDAEEKALAETARLAVAFPNSKIIMTVSGAFFWPDAFEQEKRLKLSFLLQRGVAEERIIWAGESGNTCEEISRVRAAIIYPSCLSGFPCVIVAVADRAHSRSVRAIFRKVFPEAKVFLRSVVGDWDDPNYPVVFGTSKWRWLLANIIRHAAFLLLGERIAKIRHPLKIKTA